jgi:RecB family exonuclease
MLRLSPFRIQIFLRCKKEYSFRYIEKLEEHYQIPKPYLVMGEHVHRALDRFYKIPTSQKSQDKLHQLLRESWILNRSCFKNDRKKEKLWGQKALNMLSLYYENRFQKDKIPVFLEQYLDFKISDDLILSGKVDRIDENSDGSFHVIDYKTGKTQAQNHFDDLQLLVYSFLAFQKYQKPVSRASYWYLASNSDHNLQPTPDDLEACVLEIEDYAQKISSERKFAPSPNPYCKNCDFLEICPANPLKNQ